ncbi:MAG: HhH-GPD-type base excision DNA repair protein [Acidimicrobiia bacterium]
MDRPESLPFTESDEANRLLANDGFALLLGMLLDQQFPMERAFFGPQLLKERLGNLLDPEQITEFDLDDLETVFRGPPAIHRYPASMAKRAQELARVIVDDYGGDAQNLWMSAGTGKELLGRLRALPGFGAEKSRIFVGLLGKRLGVEPEGWEEVAADWPSIADVASFDDVGLLRERKKAMKAAKKAESA